MKNKNILFFLIKLLILLITNAAMVAVYFVVGGVLSVVGLEGLLGEANTTAVKYGVTFLVFLVYTMLQVRRFKVDADEASGCSFLRSVPFTPPSVFRSLQWLSLPVSAVFPRGLPFSMHPTCFCTAYPESRRWVTVCR